MKEKLLAICHSRLAVLKDCIEHYESYYIQYGLSMYDPIPTTHQESEAIGKFVKQIGSELDDYELIGIGQTFIAKAELLLLEEVKPRNEHS